MDEARPLSGKVALVTGAVGGIGFATAVALAQAGADVALNDLAASPRLEDLGKHLFSLGRRALQLPADISDQRSVETMISEIVGQFGRLDILVSTAVYSDREPFTSADMTGFRRTMDVSLWGSFYALRAAANQMIKHGQGGSIVIVSSPHAHVAFPNCMAYNMAKAAQDQMARTACIELSRIKFASISSTQDGLTPRGNGSISRRKTFSASGRHCRPVGWLSRRKSLAASSFSSTRLVSTSTARR